MWTFFAKNYLAMLGRAASKGPTGTAGAMTMTAEEKPLQGILHVFIAFDWGEEIQLDAARQLWPARSGDLVRRLRTPSTISYHPAPLEFQLPPIELDLPEMGRVQATVEATAFDFGAVSVALRVPFSLTPSSLTRVAASLAEPESLVAQPRRPVTLCIIRCCRPSASHCCWI